MKITATAFRKNLYNYLDSVLEEGNKIEIERKGETIIIMKKEKKDIYAIMSEQGSSHNDFEINEAQATYGQTPLPSPLDENWEKQWDQQWDKWLSEK